MTDKHGDENQPSDESARGRDKGRADEPDLRSILGGTRSGTARSGVRRTLPPEPSRPGDDTDHPPEPPGPARSEQDIEDAPGDQRLPPVWPGDEEQEWFRRERGLPPLPGSADAPLDPGDLPSPLADVATRGRAYVVGIIVPNILGLIPTLGLIFGTIFLVIDLVLFRQGQDIGAAVFRLRVLRENGDVAGFYTMWVRRLASIISMLAVGAGFWTAFSDPHFRTWHDKWLGTYVVKDTEEYRTRKRSSSASAYNWFWVSLLLIVAMSVVIAIAATPVAETPSAE